jgi:hypothetical protein
MTVRFTHPWFDLPQIQRIERPPDALALLADWLSESDAPVFSEFFPPDEDRVQGWAFAHEAWMVATDPADSEEVETMMRQAEDHVLHRHPNRREIRLVAGATWTETAMVMRERGKDLEVMPADRVSGYVIESLQKLVKALR